jgi:putative peptidoglycan lipid II flippase
VSRRPSAQTLLGAAAGIAVVTVVARVVGFGRLAVFGRAVGPTCIGDTYQLANAVPNVVFEVVAGGALASLVVPVLAGAIAAGDRTAVSRTTSALLTWTVLVLLPLAVVGALTAPVLMRVLVGGDPACAGTVEVGSRMLVVFMPQVVLYGVGIVLAGVLQAHRRFLGPALAPLLSSVVVLTSYLLYAALGRAESLRELSLVQELVLSVGTTLGVAVLSLGLLVPLRRCGLRLRPTLAFPPDVAGRVRRLAVAGMAGLAAQQVALVVALRLAANDTSGTVVVFTLATALFLLPWAVLAVPVATSAFPLLSASAEAGDDTAYAEVAGRSVRAVLLLTVGAAAVLVAVALPVARVLLQGAPGEGAVLSLAGATRAFAPGLVGYGLLALLARALYARGDGRTPAVATVTGWLTVAVADVVLVLALPERDVAVLLGVGSTFGVTIAGAALLVGVHRATGGAALRGAWRAAASGLTGALVVLSVAWLLPSPDAPSLLVSVAHAAALAAGSAAVYLCAVRLLDPSGVRELSRG